MFIFLRQLIDATQLTFAAVQQSIDIFWHRAHSSNPGAAASGVQRPNCGTDRQTDRQTDGRSTVS